jgi:KaiC/GvpD/RAD55 family RecA-like ATPase
MKRIPSGIEGLDKLIEGGIPENFTVLVGGGCGTGKTIFGLQFLCNPNDTGIFVSFEEDLDQLRVIAKTFGWDIDKLEKQMKLRFLRYDPFRFEDVFELLESNIKEMNAHRIVLDSISSLGVYMRDISELRRTILLIQNLMKKNSCTAVLISEVNQPDALSKFGVEEFVCDGVINLQNILSGSDYKRKMSIKKLRGTNHSTKVHEYFIEKGGIKVVR